MPRKKEAGFEEKLSQLEDIVSTLEQGNISLEDIMKNYSNGMELSRKCLEELQRAEKEMEYAILHQSEWMKIKVENNCNVMNISENAELNPFRVW